MAVPAEIALSPEREYEIVAGQPEEKEMGGGKHSGVGTRLIVRLGGYVEAHQLGGVYGPDASFRIGLNERLPDVAFVSAARIPPEGEPDGIWPIAPDLAVEVISPNDLYEKVNAKLAEYFAGGVRQVWIVSAEHKTITIYHSPTRTEILTETDELVSGEIVPGFRCRVGELFKQPAHS